MLSASCSFPLNHFTKVYEANPGKLVQFAVFSGLAGIPLGVALTGAVTLPVPPLVSPGGCSLTGGVEGCHSALIKQDVPTSVVASQKAVCRMTLGSPHARGLGSNELFCAPTLHRSGIPGEALSQGK